MGRGRAKAKQTKVARELKYSVSDLDAERLKAELSGAAPSPFSRVAAVEEDDDDPYATGDGDDRTRR